MQERAELSGGTYEAESAPGKGTRICVRWPSVAALEREIAGLPRRIVRSICNTGADAPDGVADASASQIESFMFCVACHKRPR
jgi:hypothetical protein